MVVARTSAKEQARREKCIAEYSSKSKFRSVQKWPARIAMTKEVSVTIIAQALQKPPPRISEFISFIKEPTEDEFIKIEKMLYDAGV